jgi:hypothetical protein
LLRNARVISAANATNAAFSAIGALRAAASRLYWFAS